MDQKNPDYLKGKTLDELVLWIFSELDTDSDGYITEEEFLQVSDSKLAGLFAISVSTSKKD